MEKLSDKAVRRAKNLRSHARAAARDSKNTQAAQFEAEAKRADSNAIRLRNQGF